MNSLLAKTYTLSAPYSLYLQEEAVDTNIGSDGIIAETVYSAISPGTEVGAYKGLPPLRTDRNPYPRVVGYCNVAEVIATGKEVSKVETGDYILSFQSHRTVFRYSENDFFIKLPKGNIRHFATAYLYHLGYHSLLSANASQGNNIGIIGAGVLGYTTAVMSDISGAKTFLFSNQAGAKEKLKSGNVICLGKDNAVEERVNIITDNIGIDIIINTSNSWADWLLALKLCNKAGTIVNLGFPGRGENLPEFNPFLPEYVYMKSLTIKALMPLEKDGESTFTIRRNLKYIIDLISTGRIKPDDIISSEISYNELQQQYDKYINRSNYLLSTIVNWKN